jgi:hypothetical protein
MNKTRLLPIVAPKSVAPEAGLVGHPCYIASMIGGQTSMPQVEFARTISVSKQSKPMPQTARPLGPAGINETCK